MKCVACGRTLTTPTKTVPSKNGPLSWGPVCAKRVFVVETRSRYPRIENRPVPREVDPAQMELEIA